MKKITSAGFIPENISEILIRYIEDDNKYLPILCSKCLPSQLKFLYIHAAQRSDSKDIIWVTEYMKSF